MRDIYYAAKISFIRNDDLYDGKKVYIPYKSSFILVRHGIYGGALITLS